VLFRPVTAEISCASRVKTAGRRRAAHMATTPAAAADTNVTSAIVARTGGTSAMRKNAVAPAAIINSTEAM
jgi:hypothetical protein